MLPRALLQVTRQHVKGQDKWRKDAACPTPNVSHQEEPLLQLFNQQDPPRREEQESGGWGCCDYALRDSGPSYYLTPVSLQGLLNLEKIPVVSLIPAAYFHSEISLPCLMPFRMPTSCTRVSKLPRGGLLLTLS